MGIYTLEPPAVKLTEGLLVMVVEGDVAVGNVPVCDWVSLLNTITFESEFASLGSMKAGATSFGKQLSKNAIKIRKR